MRIRSIAIMAALIGTACPLAAQESPKQEPPAERDATAAPPIMVQVSPPVMAAPERLTTPVAQSLIGRAIRLARENRFEDALAELDIAEGIAPNDVYIWANRGIYLAQMNRGDEALEALDRADLIAPENEVALNARGLIALQRQEFAAAVDYFSRSLVVEPGSGWTLFQRALANYSLSEFATALIDTEAAIAGTPNYLQAHNLRVTLLAAMKREPEAIAAVDAMLAANPDEPYFLASASVLYRQLGLDERADALVDSSLLTEETPVALLTSAQRRSINETDVKLRELNRALELDPNYQAALYERAQTLWLESRNEAALADARRLIELSPEVPMGYHLAARSLIELDRRTQARNMADELAQRRPTDAAALATAAEIHRLLRNEARANELLDQSARLATSGPRQVEALLQRMDQRPITDLDGRASDINAALQIDPRNIGATFQLGWVQQLGGDFTAAVTTMERFVELTGRDAESLNALAIAMALAARLDEAEALFTEARMLAVNADALNSICWSKVLSNIALNRAEEECRASLAMTDRPETRDSLGMVLLRQGRLAEALTEYDSVLETIDSPVSRFARAIVRARLGNAAGARADAAEARRLGQGQQLDDYFIIWGFEIPPAIAP